MLPHVDSIRTHPDGLGTVDDSSPIPLWYLAVASGVHVKILENRLTLASLFALPARKSTNCKTRDFGCRLIRLGCDCKIVWHALMHPYLPKALASVTTHRYVVRRSFLPSWFNCTIVLH